jgi:hypothetical protein
VINWDTVRTSLVGAVFAAIFVTLFIEYLAKPRLEARKDRILAIMRARREFLAAITNISMAAQLLLLDVPRNADREIREKFRLERQRQYERLQESVLKLFDNVGEFGAIYRGAKMRDTIVHYVMCLYGLTMSKRTRRAQAEAMLGMAIPAAKTFEPRLLHLWSWARAFLELQRRISDIETDRGGGGSPLETGLQTSGEDGSESAI